MNNSTGLPRTPGFGPENSVFWETSQARAVGTLHHPASGPWTEAGREMEQVEGTQEGEIDGFFPFRPEVAVTPESDVRWWPPTSWLPYTWLLSNRCCHGTHQASL